MFRCFPRSGGNALRPLWLPTLTHAGGSRGIKLAAMLPRAGNNNNQGHHKGGPRFSQEGRQRLAELAAQNIGLNTEVKPVRGLTWGSINVKVATRHTVQRYDMDCFTGFGRAYTEAVCRRYLADNTKPLWWSAKLVAGGSPVVRNKGSSRMNVAFREALRGAGYDLEGWRVGDPEPGGGQQQQQQNKAQPWRRKIVQLYGSVEVAAHQFEMLHNAKFTELQAYFVRVVKGLEEELGRAADGSFAAPNKGQPARGTPDRGKPRGGSEQRGGSDRQGPTNRPMDRLPHTRKQDGLNAEASTGRPQAARATPGGTRRLDLGRPASSDTPSAKGLSGVRGSLPKKQW
ncbi:hypothetical protein VMCG_08446 [Cytospora schulzeri]|uniref:Uncharacterized protein n=1 Tax=Cytospora schulzeri TaxID=448051 RepID=A0A423VWI8_9PEZI|nr:hypothetical protein VMCG_08446 [Valsa malicola]